MILQFGNSVHQWDDLYAGEEDIPDLALTVHLHTWQFSDISADISADISDMSGEARFRVEIREGDLEESRRPVGFGYVSATAERIVACHGSAPLGQAVLDGVLSHDRIREFFMDAAKQALKLPEAKKEAPIVTPVFKNRKIRIKNKRKKT